MSLRTFVSESIQSGLRLLGAATGFVRSGPNRCLSDGGYYTLIGSTPLLDDNTVKNIVLNSESWFPGGSSIPASAKSVFLLVDLKIVSKGVAGTHELNMMIYKDHAGTKQQQNVAVAVYEQAGLAAGLWIGGFHLVFEFPITGTGGEITFKLFDSAGVVGSQIQGWQVVGYSD